jgi:hypothetical protein
MKKIITSLSLLLVSVFTHAQHGLENIIVEKYYVSNAADSIGSIGTLPVGSVTYRIYADMLPGYKFEAAYGVPGHELRLETTTKFFNNEDRGQVTPIYTKVQASHNTVMLDSWLSVGGASANSSGIPDNFGVLKSEDNAVSNVTNTDGILQNADASAGIPLTSRDGLLAGTPQEVTTVGFTVTDPALEVFNATSEAGNLFTTSNGSWAALNGAVGPTASNRVLIAQMTTDGVFTFQLNIQIGTPTGGTQNYVAKNPVGNEIQLPSLTFSSLLFNIKMFVEGYYQNPGTAFPMDGQGAGGALFTSGISDKPSDVDSVTLSLIDSTILANTFDYDLASAAVVKGVLQTDGMLRINLPAAVNGHKYFLKLVQRNSIEAWSAHAVLISNNALYDFTDNFSKAFDDFANSGFYAMKQMSDGKWAFYSGDIDPDHDGGVNIFDIPELSNELNLENPFGYLLGDLDGDGGATIFDIPYLANNINIGVFTQHP